MAQEHTTCNRCGQSISIRDFEKGRALILLRKAWCHVCMQRMVEKGKKSSSGEHSPKAHGKAPTPKTRPATDLSPRQSLRAGDHVCLLYPSEAEREEHVVHYLSEGLKNGEKVLYAVDDPSAGRVLGYLKKTGIPIKQYQKSGQMEIHSTASVYAPGGRFDPSEMIARIKMLYEQALKEGYQGLRGTGEMTWALKGWPGSERLAEYELRLNSALAGTQCTALCQYDSAQFKPSALKNIRAAHPIIWMPGSGKK
jgi:hypothetical protein